MRHQQAPATQHSPCWPAGYPLLLNLIFVPDVNHKYKHYLTLLIYMTSQNGPHPPKVPSYMLRSFKCVSTSSRKGEMNKPQRLKMTRIITQIKFLRGHIPSQFVGEELLFSQCGMCRVLSVRTSTPRAWGRQAPNRAGYGCGGCWCTEMTGWKVKGLLPSREMTLENIS